MYNLRVSISGTCNHFKPTLAKNLTLFFRVQLNSSGWSDTRDYGGRGVALVVKCLTRD